MFGVNQQTTTIVPQTKTRLGVRQKYAMKKAAKQQQQPIAVAQTGRKHVLSRHRKVSVVKPSLFQRIKMAILSRLQWLKNKPAMITSGPAVTSKKMTL